MKRRSIKKHKGDPDSMEKEIQRRLQKGKIKLIISHFLAFMATMAIIFFVI